MSDRVDITFTVTRADWIALGDAIGRAHEKAITSSAALRKVKRRQVLVVALIMILGGVLFINQRGTSVGIFSHGTLIVALLSLVLYFTRARTVTMGFNRAVHEAGVRRQDVSDYTGEYRVSIDPRGISFASPARQTTYSWHIAKLVQVEGMGGIQFGIEAPLLIPPHAFPNSAAAAEFYRLADQWHTAAQRPHAERLARYLADRDDALCPACSYNLRGVSADTCPECGLKIRLEDLRTPPRTL